jgi:hypothetical protein
MFSDSCQETFNTLTGFPSIVYAFTTRPSDLDSGGAFPFITNSSIELSSTLLFD